MEPRGENRGKKFRVKITRFVQSLVGGGEADGTAEQSGGGGGEREETLLAQDERKELALASSPQATQEKVPRLAGVEQLSLAGGSGSALVVRNPLMNAGGGSASPSSSASPLARITPPSSADTRSSPKRSASVGSGSGSGRAHTPYKNGHLFNALRSDFDRAAPPFCFLCGEAPREGGSPLTESIERTGFKANREDAPQWIYIYRPIFACVACRQLYAARCAFGDEVCAPIIDSCRVFYET